MSFCRFFLGWHFAILHLNVIIITATSIAEASTDAVIIAVTTTVAIVSSALVAFSAAVFSSVSAAH